MHNITQSIYLKQKIFFY